jgi:hypothetical protein
VDVLSEKDAILGWITTHRTNLETRIDLWAQQKADKKSGK